MGQIITDVTRYERSDGFCVKTSTVLLEHLMESSSSLLLPECSKIKPFLPHRVCQATPKEGELRGAVLKVGSRGQQTEGTGPLQGPHSDFSVYFWLHHILVGS